MCDDRRTMNVIIPTHFLLRPSLSSFFDIYFPANVSECIRVSLFNSKRGFLLGTFVRPVVHSERYPFRLTIGIAERNALKYASMPYRRQLG